MLFWIMYLKNLIFDKICVALYSPTDENKKKYNSDMIKVVFLKLKKTENENIFNQSQLFLIRSFQTFRFPNLNQIFLMDSPINLKYRFILEKLSKMKTRIFAAY
jgi:hypothetical protein